MRRHILISVLVLSFAGLLSADSLILTVTPNAGNFLYQFTLTNTGTTGGALYDLFLALPTDIASIDTATIGTPVGWGDPTGGLVISGPDVSPSTSFVDWSADFSMLYDVAIGDSLSGFSFNSAQRIDGPILYDVNSLGTFETAQEVSGVPEPGTLVLLLPALVGIGVRMLYRRA